MTDLSRLDADEKLLVARFEDLWQGASGGNRCRFTSFLNERQQMLAEEAVRQWKLDGGMLFGGYDGAVRCIMGFFPSWHEPEQDSPETHELYPIVPVTCRLPSGAALNHRDVLGSLMSLGIVRESVGDILLSDGRCDIFLLDTVAPVVLDELHKIGGVGVRCETGVQGGFKSTQQYKEMRGTVRSPRIDALVAILACTSRAKAAAMIQSENVQRNYKVAHNTAEEFYPGDVITIRGYGKYKVDDIGAPTKKGRLPVSSSKYL